MWRISVRQLGNSDKVVKLTRPRHESAIATSCIGWYGNTVQVAAEGLAIVVADLSTGSTPSLTDSAFANRVTKWRRVSASRLPCYHLVAGLARSLCICRRFNAGFYHRASDLPDIQKRAPASATAGDHAQL